MSFIRSSVADQIGTIAFDHDAKRNALGADLIAEVLNALEQFETDRVRVVILRSASGGKVWSAGHDISELPKADVDPLPYDDPLEQLLRAVKHFPGPVIAMVQGSVWGGACDLIMACDLVYGDETSAFAITPAKLGLPYNVVGFLNFLNRLPLNVAKEMFFSGELIPASRAQGVGIVNEIVPAAELEAHTYAMARTIASRSSQSIAAAKDAMRVLSESSAISPSTYEYLHGLRRRVYFGADYHEGVSAFLEKRRPHFA